MSTSSGVIPGVEPLSDLSQVIRHHPKFEDAARHYIKNILNWRAGPALLHKVAANYIRLQIVGYILYLHYRAGPDDPDGGATYIKLMDLCNRREQCSSRVLITVIALLRLAGFVTVTRGGRDKRLKLIKPTDRLIAYVRNWYVQTLGCFDVLDPSFNLAHQVETDPSFLGRFTVNYGDPYVEHTILVGEYFPDMLALMKLDCGFPVIGSIAESALMGDAVPSLARIADRFGASHSQVRNVVRAVVKLNLATLSATGRIENVSPLVAGVQDFIARELAFYAKFGLDLESRLRESSHQSNAEVWVGDCNGEAEDMHGERFSEV